MRRMVATRQALTPMVMVHQLQGIPYRVLRHLKQMVCQETYMTWTITRITYASGPGMIARFAPTDSGRPPPAVAGLDGMRVRFGQARRGSFRPMVVASGRKKGYGVI